MMKKNILITGGRGLVGSNIIKRLHKNKNYNIISLDKIPTNFEFCKNLHIDITNKQDVINLKKLKPDLIIHCAALTNITFCENNKELAYKVNVEGTKNIAELARMTNAKLIYLSTDVVFDGKKGNYTEKDITNPLNIYGKTKLEGEKYILSIGENGIVARTNLFGKNIFKNKLSFIESILDNLSKGKEYPAFYDAIFSPLYIMTLIDYLMELYKKDANGIFHVVGSESLSKYEFALLVAETFNYDKLLIKKETIDSLYPKDKIKRNKNCSLDNSKMLNILGLKSTPTMKEMLINFKNQK